MKAKLRLLGVMLLAFGLPALGQSLIDWATLDGGGGTSTGGTFSVTGSIGQPDAGAMGGGAFSLTGGFWSFFSAVQTPGAPLLAIRQDVVRGIIIEWPRPSEGWVLDCTSSFSTNAAATIWMQVPFPYETNATHISIATNAANGHWFFRLRLP